MTDSEKVQVVRNGGRVPAQHSMHAAVKIDAGPHRHQWRVIVCDSGGTDRDVCECSICGEQQVFKCDFDDEYS